jgi:hypothetical protein
MAAEPGLSDAAARRFSQSVISRARYKSKRLAGQLEWRNWYTQRT